MKLSNRVEALTGPDREIDAEIALAIGLRIGWHIGPDGHIYSADNKAVLAVSAYTASLDAAMMLVPEGWSHGYRWNAKHKNARGWCEYIPPTPFAPEELLTVESRKCATPAIALTAAALRARGL